MAQNPTALRPNILANRLCRLAPAISDADWIDGARWYPAEREAIRQACGYDGPAHVKAYAALSPQKGPRENRRLLAQFLATGTAGQTASCVRNAQRVLADPTAEPSLAGLKVRSFARALLGDEDSVTVDRWAVRACGITKGRMANGSLTPKQYRAFEEAYRIAADRLGISPRTLQAAAWIHVRGTTGQ